MAGELDVYESIIEQIAGEGIFDKNMIIRAINNEINSLKDDAKQESLVPKDEEAAAEDAAGTVPAEGDLVEGEPGQVERPMPRTED
jgi:hypothetical protein